MQKPGKAQLGSKVGNTIVPHLQIIPKNPEFATRRLNAKYLKTQAKHYKALTWAEEDTQEDSDQNMALPSIDLEEDRVYLIKCLNMGTLQALELYNDSKEGINIHCTKTMESFIANTLAPKKEPVKAVTEKQTKHTNSQRLAEEASKGKLELPFKEIVTKEY